MSDPVMSKLTQDEELNLLRQNREYQYETDRYRKKYYNLRKYHRKSTNNIAWTSLTSGQLLVTFAGISIPFKERLILAIILIIWNAMWWYSFDCKINTSNKRLDMKEW